LKVAASLHHCSRRALKNWRYCIDPPAADSLTVAAAFSEVAYAACNERCVRALEGGLNTRRAENRTASDIMDLPVANG
ncbi:hypothetical protein, partial [Bradyrhizobium sp.]|uniref:hypothetical protein n=1 Tax=Bradyrhizobium sp. TaxID=376 RepID=UPI003BB0C0C3